MASSSAASELKLSFIADINPEQDLWNMRARVVKKWRSKYWLDFILIDEKGVKIQAVLKQHLIPLFEHQLEEDNVVLISKFGVGTNTGPFKVIDHVYKINFYRCTTVQPAHGWEGVEYGFNFIPFPQIVSGVANQLLTVDVCGVVIDSKPLDIYGKEPNQYKRLMFKLQDLDYTTWKSEALER
ncbi:hypothetical protein QVD17_18465 [Tagetes erecta]|uniref:Replication protein A 70 kDa DNA-binding subunit B/D first OB fold domain-containing protein n=1 Tax=Tagetes erecta TaxID=13708 RepID=A0AAD8KHT4_TARER|nr:hypothetical protein QVD17_18465 [Tagetes erecta]